MTRKQLLAKKSALIRYLRYNAQLTLPGMPNASVAQPGAEGGTPGEGGATNAGGSASSAWRGLEPAADFMVSRLCVDNPGTPIVFVSDDARYLSVQDIPRTPLAPDIEAVQVATRSHSQCSFLDTRYAFSRDWAAHHIRFEAADGDHWNAYANGLVARSLADFITQNHFLTKAK